jgi:hypothetical protein
MPPILASLRLIFPSKEKPVFKDNVAPNVGAVEADLPLQGKAVSKDNVAPDREAIGNDCSRFCAGSSLHPAILANEAFTNFGIHQVNFALGRKFVRKANDTPNREPIRIESA